MQRRILIIAPTSMLGGAERNIALLARFMPKDRYRLSLATTFGTGDLTRAFHEEGLAAEEFRYAANPLRVGDLLSYVSHLRPELIHSFLLRGNWIASSLHRWFRTPWIASERGLDAPRPAWKSAANRSFLATARMVLAVSDPVREILIRRDRIPADKIRVLTGGIPPAEPILPWPAGWPALSRPRLVTLGHLRPEKNVALSVRLLAHVRSQGLDASLTLMGEGPERSAIEKLARELDVEGRLHAPGNILDARRLLAHFDLLVIPSKEEGFPNVMLEAWQAGLPVLSTDTPGAREISGPLNAAMLVDEHGLCGAAAALLGDTALLRDYAGRGRARAGDFSIERVVDQLSRLYDEVLSTP